VIEATMEGKNTTKKKKSNRIEKIKKRRKRFRKWNQTCKSRKCRNKKTAVLKKKMVNLMKKR